MTRDSAITVVGLLVTLGTLCAVVVLLYGGPLIVAVLGVVLTVTGAVVALRNLRGGA